MRVRQCDRECAAFSYDRFQRDMAFEGLDDALADGQSQSCSLGEFVEFLETVQRSWPFSLRECLYRYRPRESGRSRDPAELVPDRDMPFGCELPCIVNEVRAYL